MYPFTFIKVNDNASAINAAKLNDHAKFIGGGTNLVDLMKMNVEKPDKLININTLNLKKIERLKNGNVMIGALVKNSDLAYDTIISKKYPLLSKAILSGASAQLRNMATTGGNLLQRTRCYYFFDTQTPCNKREPGSGCSAITGYNRIHAILGTSDKCIATHPSDMSVAMAALDAIVHVQSENGLRTIRFADFHTLPGNTPEIEHTLQKGELITGIEIPALPFASNSTYLKVRDRASYEFALASAAVALDVHNGTIKNARIAMGGIGTKPWRMMQAEQALIGKQASLQTFKDVAELALKDAKGYKYNSFKIELAKRTLIRALQTTGGIL